MDLTSLMDEPGRITYPGILDLSGSRKSDFKSGTLPVLLPDWTIERRVDKYFEFLRAWDRREDPLLRDIPQQFSHRLHWDEHPYCDVIKNFSLQEKIWLTLLFSFTNEKWDTFMAAVEGGNKGLREKLADESYRPCRSDLFQIYYPKGTNVREWLAEGPAQAAKEMQYVIGGRNSPWPIMTLAYAMRDYFVTYLGFSNALYPCKNFARYMAMGSPDIVDPESYVHPGTGSFRGLHQMFGGDYLMATAKYEIGEHGQMVPLNKAGAELFLQFRYLSERSDNPVLRQNIINHEDKMCFMFKHLAMHAGVQKPTKSIPYGSMFPENWSLVTGKYDRT